MKYMSHKNSSDAGVFLWLTYQALKTMNLDANRIFAEIKLPDELPDRAIRRDNSTQKRFWKITEQVSQDPDIGLHVGENILPLRGEVFEYLFRSSATFGEGLQRALKYQKILSDAFTLELTVQDNHAILAGFNHPVRHYLECGIGLFLKFLQYSSDQKFSPKEIWLSYTNGADLAEYQRVWGCPVRLGMTQGRIIFEAKLLDLALASAEPLLAKLHEQIAQQQLKVLDNLDVVYQIEALLQAGLLETKCDQNIVAEKLGLHPRKLRADLQSIHTSFEQILANYREKTARKLLAETQITLDQIVYLLGFSEPSAFSRAFKRWTGETPTQYRQRKQQENDLN